MSPFLPNWRSFREIPAAAEAACASSSSRYSLDTLEIACDYGSASFALTERKETDLWRWAIVSPDGWVVDEGLEPTQAYAQRAAEAAMRPLAV